MAPSPLATSNKAKTAHKRYNHVTKSKKVSAPSKLTIRQLDVVCIGNERSFVAPQPGNDLLFHVVRSQTSTFQHFQSSQADFKTICELVVDSVILNAGSRFVMADKTATRWGIMSRPQALVVVASIFRGIGEQKNESIELTPNSAIDPELAPYIIKTPMPGHGIDIASTSPGSDNYQKSKSLLHVAPILFPQSDLLKGRTGSEESNAYAHHQELRHELQNGRRWLNNTHRGEIKSKSCPPPLDINTGTIERPIEVLLNEFFIEQDMSGSDLSESDRDGEAAYYEDTPNEELADLQEVVDLLSNDMKPAAKAVPPA